MLQRIVPLGLALLLCACQITQPEIANTPLKGQQDPADYQYLMLDNGLKVLLVSDAQLSKVYGALSVEAGYYQDPPDMAGLAHLYEHMLSKGSQKYPDPAEYKQFLAEQGGRSNAATSALVTNYYFEAASDGFIPALDRFAWQFVGPLLPAQMVYKERNAVQAEFNLKYQDAFRRKREVMRTLFHPEHGYRKFSTGNLDTLQDREDTTLHQALVDFGQDYYCSSRMALVLAGPQSMQQLGEQAKSKFGAVQDNCRKTLNQQPAPLLADAPRQVEIKTLRKRSYLTLSFPLPVNQASRDTLAIPYTQWLLASYNDQGLEAYLRDKGWIQSLSASDSELDSHHALFNLSFNLTGAGMKEEAAIMAATFAYVQQIRQQALDSKVFETFSSLSAAQFHQTPEHADANRVRALSKALLQRPVQQLLSQDSLPVAFNPRALTDFWSHFNAQNMLVIREGSKLNTQMVEPIYQTEFQYAAIPDWQAQSLDFSLPGLSDYFAASTEALAVTEQKVTHQPGLAIWQLPARRDKDSYTAITLYIDRPTTAADFSALNVLFEKRLQLQLQQVIERASAAKIQASVTATSSGMRIQVKGQSGNWSALFADMLAGLQRPELDDTALRLTLKRRINSLAGFAQERLSSQADRLLSYQLGRASLAQDDLAHLQQLSEDHYRGFTAAYLQDAYLTLITYGPLQAEQTQQLIATVQGLAEHNNLASHRLIDSKPWPGEHQQYPVAGSDSAVTLMLVPKRQDVQQQAMVELLGSMLKAPFFHQLRTQEQLGYRVSALAAERYGKRHISYYVQSPVTSAQQLLQRIAHFNQVFIAQIASLQPAEFSKLQQNLVSALQQQQINSGDIEADLRSHIRYQRGLEHHQQLLHAIVAMPLPAFQEMATTLLNSQLSGVLLQNHTQAGTSANLAADL
ncbi:insulinase family protein [Bowmanella denitrificans]|uniref:Protease 3 n=1 Tax=Bowmanella denitrificans TaxID=366582 RepID=A0ABN0WKL6_9ALTE